MQNKLKDAFYAGWDAAMRQKTAEEINIDGLAVTKLDLGEMNSYAATYGGMGIGIIEKGDICEVEIVDLLVPFAEQKVIESFTCETVEDGLEKARKIIDSM